MTSIKEALEGLIEAVKRDADLPGGRGISGYTSARLSDAAAALAQLDSADAREVWRKAGDVPLIKPGASQQYILAVYRKHSGKVYSFAAEYLNDYPLRYDWGCPKDHKGICDGCSEDGCPTTGWYVIEGADDDGYTYHALSLSDGDRIEGWREVPRWEDRSTGFLPDASPGNGAEKVSFPATPDDDADFTPDLARKIIARYQQIIAALHSTSAAGETTSSDGAESQREVQAQMGPAKTKASPSALGAGDRPSEAIPADEIERKMMDIVDLIAATLEQPSDKRAWDHLLIYAPRDALERRLSTITKGEYHDTVLAPHRADAEVRKRDVDCGGLEPGSSNQMADEQNGNAAVRMEISDSGGERVAIPADVLAMKEACKRVALDAKAIEVEIFDAANRDHALSDTGRQAIQDRALARDSLARNDIAAAIDKLSPEVKAEGEQHVATVTYTSWRGETSVRRIIPKAVCYGSTEWHPEPQWLLLAWDDDKQADREFALKDFGVKAEGWRGEPVCQFCKRQLATTSIVGTHGLCCECVPGGFPLSTHPASPPDVEAIVGLITDNLELDWHGREAAERTRDKVTKTARAISVLIAGER